MKQFIIIFFLLILVTGCSTTIHSPTDEAEPLLSIKMTDTSATRMPIGMHGVFLTLTRERFDRVDLFVFQNGRLVSNLYSGTDFTWKILEALEALPKENLDYAGLSREIRKQYADKGINLGFVLDGAEYELEIHYGGKHIQFRLWNLYDEVETLADYDERFMALRDLLEIILIKIGRRVSGI